MLYQIAKVKRVHGLMWGGICTEVGHGAGAEAVPISKGHGADVALNREDWAEPVQ